MDSGNPKPVDGIVGFAFGNRWYENGNRSGNTTDNAELKNILARYYQAIRKVHNKEPYVLVQWEIGQHLTPTEKRAMPQLQILNPDIDPLMDNPKYVSTEAVMKMVEIYLPKESSVLIVAQPNHLHQCMLIAREARYKPVGVRHPHPPTTPPWYDSKSGQLWTTDRLLNLVHGAISKLNFHRNKKLNPQARQTWKSGSPILPWP